ncbi:MB12A protein, partial [Nyctiprogne leucopyga]|nr:MB12A protein [Nyctiprogne leucopyga]
MAAEEEAPLTGLAWAAAPEAAPAGWTAITVTVEGAAANLGKGFGHKSGGYLCVSTGGGAQAAPGSVVTDVQVLSDRSPQPPGYTRIPEFPEPRAGVPRKKRVYVKLEPREAAGTGVVGVKLSSRGRAVPGHLRVGDLGNFALWCKKGPVSRPSPPPVPPPRALSAALGQLSLQPPPPSEPSIIINSLPPPKSYLNPRETNPATSLLWGSLANTMDGVPFTLHPKFEPKLRSGTNAVLADLHMKSLADIEKEYNYTFVIERTAAARLPPSI